MTESTPRAPEPPRKLANSPYALAAFLAAFFAVWTLRATWFYFVDEHIHLPIARSIYSNLLKTFLWLLPAAVYQYRVHGHVNDAFNATVLPRSRAWLSCLLVTVGFLLAVAGFELVFGNKRLTLEKLSDPTMQRPMWFAIVVVQYSISPLIEELFFRGFLLRTMLDSGTAGRMSILNSCLFVLIHWPFWLSHLQSWSHFATQSLGVFLVSLLACWLYVRTRSVWPPTIAHALNNLLAGMLSAST